MKQTTFASLTFDAKKKRTRREVFLAEMEQVIPWSMLEALIERHYPKSGRRGRPPMPLSTMLRIHFMQQWYALSDPGMEDALYEIESMRRFAGLDLGDDALPDETTILKFRRLLETHELAGQLLEAVNAHLGKQGLLLRQGTIVDATIVLDQEQGREARSRDASDEKGKPILLRHEGAHRRGRGIGPGTHGHDHASPCGGRDANRAPAARQGKERMG
jgi:hypothetical protein